MAEEPYALRVAQQLRAVRAEQRLSREDVEHRSRGAFKVEVLARWESGGAISWPRLAELACFYGVHSKRLLPP